MSPAGLLAAAAGALAAAGAIDLAEQWAWAKRRRARGSRNGFAAMVVAAVGGVGRRVGAPAAPEDLAHRLDAAGARPGALADVMAIKAGGALAGALAGLPLAASLPGRLGLVAPAAAAGAGFLVPDLWLRRRIRSRARAMSGELADVLDLLRVALQAGLPVSRALAEVGRRHRGALAKELRRAADQVALGASRATVLATLPRHIPIAEATTLIAILERADRYGAPPAEALAALAAEARSNRTRAAAEAAARAAPQIQLVIALLLVPAVLLLVAAALIPAL